MSSCEVCGRTSHLRRHHPTGTACLQPAAHPDKDSCRCFLDPELTVTVCHDHHMLCHDDWQTLGIATISRELTWVERVELRLRRLAAALGRLDQADDERGLLGLLAAALTRWADELRRFRNALDEHAPGWRDHRGFYPAAAAPIPGR